MRRSIFTLSLIVVLVTGAFTNSASSNQAADETCRTYSLVTAPIFAGEPLPDNQVVVHDGTGTEISRISVAQPERVVPSKQPGFSIIEFQGHTIGTLDLELDAVTEIEFEGAESGDVLVDPVLARQSEGSATLSSQTVDVNTIVHGRLSMTACRSFLIQ